MDRPIEPYGPFIPKEPVTMENVNTAYFGALMQFKKNVERIVGENKYDFGHKDGIPVKTETIDIDVN